MDTMRNPLSPLQNTPGASGADAMTSPGKAPTAYDCDFENSPGQDYHTTGSFPDSPPYESSTTRAVSPTKRSPVKYRLQDDAAAMTSPPDSPQQATLRFNEGMTRAIGDMQEESRQISVNHTALNEDMSTIVENGMKPQDHGDTIDFDVTMEPEKTVHDETAGDLSTISAIATDMTRFAELRNSPTKIDPPDGWTPRANRHSVAISTSSTGQKPLQLLSRRSTRSTSSNEDEEATPRVSRYSADSTNDLLNFTGQTNILIPPPGPTPRTTRRSPSGRGAFPIRVNPTPSHRSQASVDRERATGRSPQKMSSDQQIPATPAGSRSSQSSNGFGLDLLDIDLGPMATPRSIPTVTPRELETLRSELQSRISSLEATLAGKDAEVTALKRAVTDAEIRAGKAGEEARVERVEKQEILHQNDELDRRAREMEDVLREVKQNAFVEEREREKLKRQIEEAERRAEESEVKVLELNASLDTLQSDRVRCSPSPVKMSGEPTTPGQGSPVDVDAAVKNATETVARELHALYKSKHERKVADLKLSYEKRWMKQIDALKSELKESQDEVSRLLTERDLTMTGFVPGQSEALSRMEGQIEELRRWNEDLSAQKKIVEADLAGVKSELETIRKENDTIRIDLEQERVEKGELVAQVEVFLTVSAEQEREREAERESREARERERQPVSPPRSDASGDSALGASTVAQAVQSPSKRVSNGVVGVNGRPRPMSMLAKPAAGKFGSGIPGPGSTGLKPPTAGNRGSMYQRGSLMDGIARMGAVNR